MPQPPRRSDRVAYRAIDEEGVLVPIRRSVAEPLHVHTLNPVATFVWSQLDGRRTVADLAALVAAEFDTTEAVARQDIEVFLQELAEAGLVETGR